MRDLFQLAPDLVFLNHGSFGACPREVLVAQRRWQDEMERNPVEFLGRRSGALLAQAREALGAYLGAAADELVFLPNATHGVNVVAQSLALRPGDEVLATDHEYGACDAAWQRLCAQAGAVYRRVEIPLPFVRDEFVPRLLAAATPRTRLLFSSHITSTTALVLPVAALCAAARERGLATLIDGAHAPGQVGLDLEAIGADYYVGNLHKWLCAPKGAAFLHARREHHAGLHAPVLSWGYAEGVGGHSGFDAYLGRGLLQRRLQWLGTRDLSPFLAVPAAIEFQQRHDWPAQRARCHAMVVALMHRVAARTGLAPIAPDDDFAQMVPLPVPLPVPGRDGDALRRALFERHRIEVPVTSHRGALFVRVSVQAYNSDQDLRALASALAAELPALPA